MGVALARALESYTIDDIYRLPEGQRAELIDGRLFMMASPSRRHQEIVHFLDRTIGNYVQSKRGECKVYPAPFAVFLNADDTVYVEPDVSVICDKGKLTDEGCHGAPDWIVEVVSPTTRSMDYGRKLFKYHSAGVREYWIVDYDNNQVLVYDFAGDEMTYHSFSDKVQVRIYMDLEIDFSEIDME
ncbi:MAG: Uma2 family endonuclease [Ruminococcus sp.]|nr:Uma2 family endonuclease [Ruminococcus sp.]